VRLARVARRLGFQCDTSYVVLFSLVDAASRDTCEVHRVHAHFTVTQCDSFVVSRELCLIYWRRQPWGTGARAPLDLQQFIFFALLWSCHLWAYKVSQQSLVSNIFSILRTIVINISLFYI